MKLEIKDVKVYFSEVPNHSDIKMYEAIFRVNNEFDIYVAGNKYSKNPASLECEYDEYILSGQEYALKNYNADEVINELEKLGYKNDYDFLKNNNDNDSFEHGAHYLFYI